MEQNFADLLNDAFSESSVPSFPDGALDFENVNYDEKFDEDEVVNQETSEEDGALRQEATNHNVVLEASDMSEDEDDNEDEDEDEDDDDDDDEDEDDDEDDDEEDDDDDDDDEDEDEIVVEDEEPCGVKGVEANFQSVQFSLMNVEEASQEDYTSSGEELEPIECVSGEDEEVEEEDTGTGGRPGDLLQSVHCRDEFRADNKEDRIFAEGRPLAPESPEEPQVRNQEEGESESEEEASYFGNVPRIEEEEKNKEEDRVERQEDSSDSESEGMKIEAETFLHHSPEDRPTKASLEFPEISEQNLQDLIAEVDTEEYVEKMKDFSGEEHQEAGESFADYPSDFSSCEYVEEGGKKEAGIHQVHLDHITSENSSEAKHALTWMGSDEEEDEGYLYSRDLEMDADTLMSLDSSATERSREVEDEEPTKECDDEDEDEDEGSESSSYSSSDDEEQVRRSDDEFSGGWCLQNPENNKQQDDNKLQSWTTEAFSSWSASVDYRPGPAPSTLNWEIDVSRTRTTLSESQEEPQTLPSDEAPLEGVSTNSYSQIQKVEAKTIGSSSDHGSLDDGFFFAESEALETSELGQLGDDEYEEERSWEQEKERIDAFYRFYNDSDSENGREERQIKVQFCTDPLSQVIHFDSDSTDRDSLSSSSDVEEDLSYAEPSEGQRDVKDISHMVQSVCESPESNPAEFTEKKAELSNDTHISTRKNKCLHILKAILKMSLVVLMGLLMFWFFTDQVDPGSIFKA